MRRVDSKLMLRTVRTTACAGLVLLLALMGIAGAQEENQTRSAPPDTSIVMPGGQEGSVFKDLVVEGEDLIRIEFGRPELQIDIDPQSAPGLEWGSIQEIVDRNQLSLVSPLVSFCAYEHFSYHARPWLDQFASGDIVHFRPSVRELDRWQLTVADSRGETVVNFEGKGRPPKEIGWDGRSLEGQPAPPGLTYSYVLEAFDRAGNKRSFVGEGFELPPYRLENEEAVMMLFSGSDISGSGDLSQKGSVLLSPILLDVASRINQSERLDQPIQVKATARSFQKAKTLAEGIAQALAPLILGGQGRIQSVTEVEPDAPKEGAIQVVVPR